MTTLPEFLLARIGEDEGRARADAANAMAGTMYGPTGWKSDVPRWAYGVVQEQSLDHAARVLAECEAKRAIVEAVGAGLRYDVACGEGHWQHFEGILDALASVYATHPDFDPAWKV